MFVITMYVLCVFLPNMHIEYVGVQVPNDCIPSAEAWFRACLEWQLNRDRVVILVNPGPTLVRQLSGTKTGCCICFCLHM